MWIVGHAQVGWFLGRLGRLERRDRALVTWCGVLPDLDALTLLGGQDAYLRGHHVYLHNLSAAGLFAVTASAASCRRWRTFALGLAATLLHFLSDGFGYLELRPLWPFSRVVWWPNGGRHWVAGIGEVVLPIVLLGIGIALFARERFSLLEVLSPRLDEWLVAKLRERGRHLADVAEAKTPTTPQARSGKEIVRLLATELLAAVVLVAVLELIARAVLVILGLDDPRLALGAAIPGYLVVRWVLPLAGRVAVDRAAMTVFREIGPLEKEIELERSGQPSS